MVSETKYLMTTCIFASVLGYSMSVHEAQLLSHKLNENKTYNVSVDTSNDQFAGVKRVHIVYMNHLDVGYDGLSNERGFVNNVLNAYFSQYFPQAARLGEQLEQGGYVETFTYTTHPWLVDMYLHCLPHLVLSGIQLKCPNVTEIARFKAAVRRGHITWHAGPMNVQAEYMSDWLYTFGIQLSQKLDQELGVSRSGQVLSQRDVPGMTQAVIPLLAELGVAGISVGVNSMTPPPAVPKLFRWGFQGKEVLVTYHPGGYPDNPGPDPDHPGGLSVGDCVLAPAPVSEALCFAFRTDNSGPPQSIQEVLGHYAILRKEFPGAELGASTLEAFIQAVQPIRGKLPLVTMEIGDTWINGVGSDPRKTAEFRAVDRILRECYTSGSCASTDSRVWNCSRLFLKNGEHTWGLDTVGDTSNWTNSQFDAVKSNINFVNVTKSWLEQRRFTALAVEALQDHPVRQRVQAALKELLPHRPDLTDYRQLSYSNMIESIPCSAEGDIQFSLDGSIKLLMSRTKSLADKDHPLGQIVYTTYNEQDFDTFNSHYKYSANGPGVSKRNVTSNAHPESRHWPVTMQQMYWKKDYSCDLWAHVSLVEHKASVYYGAPQDFWVHYNLTTHGYKSVLLMDVMWFDKRATRLPEAIFVLFKPRPQSSPTQWWMSKLGQLVNVSNGILNGSHYQHAVDSNGLFLMDQHMKPVFQVQSPDVPLACPITDSVTYPTVFPDPLKPITDNVTGIAFNLFNNIWDTNWIFWYPYIDEDKDFKARFSIIF